MLGLFYIQSPLFQPWQIVTHMFMHGGFFDADDQLIRAAHRLRDIPGVIVHGRYDVVTINRGAREGMMIGDVLGQIALMLGLIYIVKFVRLFKV